MSVDPSSNLPQRIHDAALRGGSWSSVAEGLAAAFRCSGVAFYGQSQRSASFREHANYGIAAPYVDSYKNHFSSSDNPWISVHSVWTPGVIRTEQQLQRATGDPGILRRSGYFNEWMRPQQFEHSMSMVIERDHEEYVKLALLRPNECGPFRDDEVSQFRALCREFRFSLDIAGQYDSFSTLARLSLHALDQLAFGVVLLDADGRVLQSNHFAHSVIDARVGLGIRAGRLIADAPLLHHRITRAVASAGSGHQASTTLQADPPLVACSMSLSVIGAAPLGHKGTGSLIFIKCPELELTSRLEELRDRFDLTTAELRLAQGLLQGSTLRDSASRADMSYQTARWYLKSLFGKTGTNHQAGLVRALLLSSGDSRPR